MLSEDVPVGMSEQDNKLIKHYTLKKKIILDTALQMKFKYHLSKMSRALINFMLDTHISDFGFERS